MTVLKTSRNPISGFDFKTEDMNNIYRISIMIFASYFVRFLLKSINKYRIINYLVAALQNKKKNSFYPSI